jgi:hypothetical protein
MSVYTDNDNQLCCPLCGDIWVHLDESRVAARPDGEDGPIVGIGVNARGSVTGTTGRVPEGPTVGEGRRHRIALLGYCETCAGQFALVFTQHKGVTFAESVELPPVETLPPITPGQRFTSPDIEASDRSGEPA